MPTTSALSKNLKRTVPNKDMMVLLYMIRLGHVSLLLSSFILHHISILLALHNLLIHSGLDSVEVSLQANACHQDIGG